MHHFSFCFYVSHILYFTTIKSTFTENVKFGAETVVFLAGTSFVH